MQKKPWMVAKVTVKGVNFYELWQDGRPDMVGRYASFDIAKRTVEQIETTGQG